MNKRFLFVVLFLSCLTISAGAAPSVTAYPDPTRPLNERWKWAMDQQKSSSAVIAWSIERSMPENELMGSFYSGTSRYPTLREILTNTKDPSAPMPSIQEQAKMTLAKMESNDSLSSSLVKREIAILIGPSEKSGNRVDISMMHLQYNRKNRPILWLGKANREESLSLVLQIYAQNSQVQFREDLIAAVAMHDLPQREVPFLEKVLHEEKSEALREAAAFWLAHSGTPDAQQRLAKWLLQEKSEDVIGSAMAGLNSNEGSLAVLIPLAAPSNSRVLREQAIFWIGQTKKQEAADALLKVIASDPDVEMRKKAIFSLSQMPESMSLKPMIQIARTDESEEVRKETVFWLSQIASKRVAGVLSETATKDRSIEVQKQAIFALSEIDAEEGVTELIRIANTHSNRELRKEAIFWLGESEDPRARAALLKMIEE